MTKQQRKNIVLLMQSKSTSEILKKKKDIIEVGARMKLRHRRDTHIILARQYYHKGLQDRRALA
jgi:hypothetical protein